MRTLKLAAPVLALGLAGCAARSPAPPTKPLPPVPDAKAIEMERKRESSKFQEEVVMAEVSRTHPVLAATMARDMDRLRTELKKAPGKINEIRRDMRLGPPLREACRLKWKEGITELVDRGAKCLGDSQCESCVRSQPATTGLPPRQEPASTLRPAP